MPNPKVNLLKEVSLDHTPPTPATPDGPPPSKRKRRRFFITAMVFFLILVTLLVANVILPVLRLSASLKTPGGLLAQLQHLTFGGDRAVQGEPDDRVNVLLMGIGGAGHDGPLLSDTIMIASLQPSTGKAALISIPRDLLVPLPNGTWHKINEAYSTGETLQPGQGGTYAAQTIGSVLGLNLPYYVVVDFKGFERIIDQVGGVNVNVERSFTDTTYPTADEKGVETVSFTAGWQHMSGAQALIYARSRHGNNGEGSDFARARRQQKIILATKDKIISSGILLNPITINQLAGELADNITTNLQPWEILRLYSLSKNINPENVIRFTPDNSPGGLLVDSSTADGAYILKPRSGNFSDLQTASQQVFSSSELIQEPPRIEVQNGTNIPGLAAAVSNALEHRGYQVVATANAADRNTKETTIYDYTSGAKPISLAALRFLFNAHVATSIPSWLLPSATTIDPNANAYRTPPAPQSKADFLVIVGSDSASEFVTN